MAGSFLTNAERERANRFPSLISEDDLISFFTLSASDQIEIEKVRGSHNLFGLSLQICTLRYLGFLPHDFTSAPIEAIQFIGDQLSLSVECLKDYGRRSQTRQDHLKSALKYLGFRRANSTDWSNLRVWLIERALEHDKPALLLGFAFKYFYTEKILRPGITILEGLVIEVRQTAWYKTYLQLESFLDKNLQKTLDTLLVVDSDLGKIPIGWLRQGATSNSAISILRSLKKILFLRDLGASTWNLSVINPNRLKFLAK